MLLLYLTLAIAGFGSAERLNFPGCNRNGWKCVPITQGKVHLEYTCNPTQAVVDILMWNFRIGADIQKMRIRDCNAVIVDLTCTNEGRQLIELHIQNVTTLNFTNILHKELTQTLETMMFENISMIHNIPDKTFKQMRPVPAATYRCANYPTRLNKLVFRNVTIDRIEQNSFFDLIGIQDFIWENVRVNYIAPSAVSVEMNIGREFSIVNSRIKQLDNKAFHIKASTIHMQANQFGEMLTSSIHGTTYNFNFINNSVEVLHPNAMTLLIQNTNIINNTFQQMQSRSLQGIGPGLLENSQMSFGQIMFSYNFSNNIIRNMDVGSLNPDWTAYKNIRNTIKVSSNLLQCSCPDSGWMAVRNGLGRNMEDMMIFNERFLDRDNNNLCMNAPCRLPVEAIRALSITNNMCNLKLSLLDLCKKYNADKSTFSKLDPVNVNGKMSFYEKPGFVPVYVKHDESTEQFPIVDTVSTPPSSSFRTENPIEQILEISQKTGNSVLGKLVNGGDFKVIGSNMINESDIKTFTDQPDANDTIKFEYNLEKATEAGNVSFPAIDVRFADGSTLNSTILSFYSADEQKEAVQKAYENWQNIRRKKLVLFKIFGSYLTLE